MIKVPTVLFKYLSVSTQRYENFDGDYCGWLQFVSCYLYWKNNMVNGKCNILTMIWVRHGVIAILVTTGMFLWCVNVSINNYHNKSTLWHLILLSFIPDKRYDICQLRLHGSFRLSDKLNVNTLSFWFQWYDPKVWGLWMWKGMIIFRIW